MSGRGFGAAAGGSARDHGATVVVAALSAMFAATLIQTVGILTAAIDPRLVEESGTMRMMLFIVATVFILIALYVGSIVTANTFSTIIAGRARTIALLRLVGASSRRVRSRVAFEGLMVGLIGAAIGFAASWLLCTVFVAVAPGQGWLPAGHDYPLFDPLALVGVAVVALTTWVSAWVGSRRVGAVSPIAATGASVELDPESAQRRTGRTVFSVILLVLGAGVLALGVLVGLVSPLGLLVAFFGGLASFTGIAIGAHWIMPPLLRLSGRLLGRGVTGRLAAANAVRFPERSARATIGLVIGVTLVTMFAVALQTYQQMTMQVFVGNPAMKEALESTFAVTMAILTGLVGFSAVIAAVGMVNTLSLSVLQRTPRAGPAAGARLHRASGAQHHHRRERADDLRRARVRAAARHVLRLGRRAEHARAAGGAHAAVDPVGHDRRGRGVRRSARDDRLGRTRAPRDPRLAGRRARGGLSGRILGSGTE